MIVAQLSQQVSQECPLCALVSKRKHWLRVEKCANYILTELEILADKRARSVQLFQSEDNRMKDLRIVLCTGIDKTSKLKVLQAAKAVGANYRGGVSLHVYDFWQTLQEVAQEKGKVGKRETITQLPPRELESLRELTCYRIGEKFGDEIANEQKRAKHVAVVVTRTIAPSPSGFIRTLDRTHQVFDAEACISIIDNVERMQNNLASDSVWGPLRFSKEEVLLRRQDEIANTEDWSNATSGVGKHFVLAVNEPPETLLGLLFPCVVGQEANRRVYISFPITHADEELKKKKQEFVARLRQRYVVFDPWSITEYDVALSEYKEAKQPEDIDSATKWLEKLGPVTVDNDYRLISQSDEIVVFYPSTRVKVQNSGGDWVDAEQKVLSAGVIAEMIHAKNEQRAVRALWLSEQMPSPFFFRYCDSPIFKTEEEFFKRLG